MENLELFLSIAGAALGLFVSAITFLVKYIQNAKAKRFTQNIINMSNAIIPYIEQAELFLNYSGLEKKEFVMTKANQFAIDNGIAFKADIISQRIEELVKLTKEVNQRDKDKAVHSSIPANVTPKAGYVL